MRINKTARCIILIFLGNIGVIILPEFRKVFWLFYVLSILLLPYGNLFRLSFKAKLLLLVLLTFGITVIVRGLLNPNDNTYLTIIGNPAYSMFELLPVFILLAESDNILLILHKILYSVSIATCCLIVFFNPQDLVETLVYFIAILAPFKFARYKMIIILTLMFGYFTFVMNDYRIILLAAMLLLVPLGLNKYFKRLQTLKRITTVYVTFMFLLPITLMITGLTTGFSVYQIGQMLTEDSDKGYEVDTRTFLWYEVFEDLSNNNAIAWGKGLTGRVTSELTVDSDGSVNDDGRSFVEVRALDIIRRGGVVYATVYYGAIFLAVLNVLFKTKNRFLLVVAIVVTSFYFLNFIGTQPAVNLYSVLFWILIGLCFSRKWNNYSDDQIKEIIYIKSSLKEHVSFRTDN